MYKKTKGMMMGGAMKAKGMKKGGKVNGAAKASHAGGMRKPSSKSSGLFGRVKKMNQGGRGPGMKGGGPIGGKKKK